VSDSTGGNYAGTGALAGMAAGAFGGNRFGNLAKSLKTQKGRLGDAERSLVKERELAVARDLKLRKAQETIDQRNQTLRIATKNQQEQDKVIRQIHGMLGLS